jgi:membrane associated rhomboid family serine protease
MRMQPAARALLIASIIVFLLQSVTGGMLIIDFALWPLGAASLGQGVSFEPWQLVTYGFLHGGLTHLFLNMLALWMFGNDVERTMGTRRFVIYYFVCLVAAGLCQLMVAGLEGERTYPVIGASGAIFGVLLAFAVYFPRRIIVLLIPPIPLPAWLFVTLYALLELYFGVSGRESGVAHFAHLGGMVGGYALLQYWQRARRF